MASNRMRTALALCATLLALPACSPNDTPSSPAQSARAGFGAPAPTTTVTDVQEAMFRTPSKNIWCSLTPSFVRCDIVQKKWTLPSKPADCEFDWANGIYIEHGKVSFTCTSDSLLNSATRTLEYGSALRSGEVVCTSESSGLTCKDEKTTRGFTMAVARYSFF